MKTILLAVLILFSFPGCDIGMAPPREKEYIDLRPEGKVADKPAKGTVYLYTQRNCHPCRPHEKYWVGRKWETDLFKVQEVFIDQPGAEVPPWVSMTPCYGWTAKGTLYSIEDGDSPDHVEGRYRATIQ